MTPQVWREILAKFLSQASEITSGKKTEELCRPVLLESITCAHSVLAECWSVNPRNQTLIRVLQEPAGVAPEVPRLRTLAIKGSVTGSAIKTKKPELFDFSCPETKASFENTSLVEAINAQYLLSAPVIMAGNPHQVLCILNFFFSNKDFVPNNWTADLRVAITELTRVLATAIESNLRERGFRQASRLTANIASLATPGRFEACATLAETLKSGMEATSTEIYLFDGIAGYLRLVAPAYDAMVATPGVPEEVEEIFQSKRERIIDSEEKGESSMLVPIQWRRNRDSVEGVAVVRKTSPTHPENASTAYNYDDIAVVEAVSQAFGPALATIRSDEQRRFSMQKLSHELRTPVMSFGAIIEQMQKECGENDVKFRFPYFREASIYHDLMVRLLREMDILRSGPSMIPLNCRPTNLLTEVITPMKRFITPTLRKYRFYTDQVAFDGFDDAPLMDVDPGLITQILFNLVENSMKHYGVGSRSDFYCRLQGICVTSGFEIRIRNNGEGIREEDIDRIFEYGERGGTHRHGDGLGLWIARAITIKHGGSLTLVSRVDPVEFLLTIPMVRLDTSSQHRWRT